MRLPESARDLRMALAAAVAVLAVLAVTITCLQGSARHVDVRYLQPAVTTARTIDHGYTGKADRVTPWQHVIQGCRVTGCTTHVPDSLRRAMGIPAGHPYRVHWGDTTFAWVLICPRSGRVLTIPS